VSAFPAGKGVATGPELSHVIGDVALAEVDERFENLLPGRYFRYVDDIVFVIEPEEKQQVLKLMNDLLEKAGLRACLKNRELKEICSRPQKTLDFIGAG
jgi:hypothetical protein